MNTLFRQIQEDEIVVVREDCMKEEYKELDKRLFKCNGRGFGTSSFTSGTAIFGEWVSDGESDRIEGNAISARETLGYQESK